MQKLVWIGKLEAGFQQVPFVRILGNCHNIVVKHQFHITVNYFLMGVKSLYNHMSWKSESVTSDRCAQRRFRSACAFAQSDQNLH